MIFFIKDLFAFLSLFGFSATAIMWIDILSSIT